MPYRRLAVLGFLVLGLFGALSSWGVFSAAGRRAALAVESVIPFEEYNCVKQAAGPAERMGYLSAEAQGADRFDFVVAQYVLVPTLLRSGYDGQDLVVGKFSDRQALSKAMALHNLELRAACGHGIYLLASKGSP